MLNRDIFVAIVLLNRHVNRLIHGRRDVLTDKIRPDWQFPVTPVD